MGRDVAGLRIGQKSSTVNLKSNGTIDGAAHVLPKALPEKVETKDHNPQDCSKDHKPKDNAVEGTVRDERQEALGIRSTSDEPEEKVIRVESQKSIDKKLNLPVKPASVSSVNGAIDANSFEPRTSGAETEIQTSFTEHANETETNDAGIKCPTKSNDLDSPKSLKKSQPNSPSMSKQSRTNCKKYYDEEDNCSLASSTATSVRTAKFRVTVPVAPRFTCEDRLERRKEFYTKLEEKHRALEKEKLEYDARTKEEEATAIKQLRKSMTYKANPVPSFYREGPPPKVELKKPPVTRAKSPNLTRRKSFGDAVRTSLDDKGLCSQATRHSVGAYKEGKNSPLTPKGKARNGARRLKETSKIEDHQQELKMKTDSSQVSEQGSSDIAVES